MLYLNIGILLLIAVLAWWLTGFDKSVTGESKRGRHFERALRCVVVVVVSAVLLWVLENPGLGLAAAPFLMIIPLSIALIMRSSVSEVFAHGFLGFLDPALHDRRPLDPGKSRRFQDAIARLIQNGQRDEAIKLCEELKLSGEVDLVTLENTLEFLGVPQANSKRENPLTQAAQMRAEGKFAEAEQRLKSLLAQNPADAGAAMMLMRLFAQDLRQPGKAHEVLRQLEKQPHVAASHVEFARRSIDEWSRPKPEKTEAAAPPESVEELLAQGFLGTAIERLEEQIKAQPQDFALRLQLAEIHAMRCKDFQRSEKMIRQMETSSNFSPQQTESARAKLKDWRAAAGNQHGMA
jgi:thioredoxin-like negative regulator of GroEL